MDPVTQSLGRLGKKATAVRVLAEIDMQKGLTPILKVGTDSRFQPVVYENPPLEARNAKNSS